MTPDLAPLSRQTAQRLHDEAFARGELVVWTIYDHPTDFPDSVVARPWTVKNDQFFPVSQALFAPTLEEIKARLPAGLIACKRHPSDDPCIIGTFL